MSVKASDLRELHRIHRQLTDLRSRLERGPKQIAAFQTSVAASEKTMEEAKEVVVKTKMMVSDKELQLKEREGRIVDVQAKLNSASSNREYQAFTEQIAADEQANSVLADEILELFDKVSEVEGAADEASAAAKKTKDEAQKLQAKIDGEKESLETDLARLTEDLSKAEANLPTDLKPDYQRLVGGRGEDALAPLDDECCGSCYQTITPQMMNELMLSKTVFCKSCGCILYLPEDREPISKS